MNLIKVIEILRGSNYTTLSISGIYRNQYQINTKRGKREGFDVNDIRQDTQLN